MALTVTKAEVQEMASKYNRATALAKSVKGAAVARFKPAKRSVIGGLTAFGIGFAEGRLGRDKSTILGAPISLVSAIALHGAAYAMPSHKKEGKEQSSTLAEYMHDAADGPLFHYAGMKGLQLGIEAASKAGAAHAPGPASLGGEALGPDEMARMARGE
jgi:hypothetical protein